MTAKELKELYGNNQPSIKVSLQTKVRAFISEKADFIRSRFLVWRMQLEKTKLFAYWCRFKRATNWNIYVLTHLSRRQAREYFEAIHTFADYDSRLIGYKYAIQYGRLYWLKTKHIKNSDGSYELDLRDRARMVDEEIELFKNPRSYNDYISLLHDTQSGVDKANQAGFFSAGNDMEANKIESERYIKVTNALKLTLTLCRLYPSIWKQVFGVS